MEIIDLLLKSKAALDIPNNDGAIPFDFFTPEMKKEYGVDLIPFDMLPKADCVIVAVGHNEFRSMSLMQIKSLYKETSCDDEKVLIDVKSLYRMDELKVSGMRFWRL